ncbi:MAG: OmpA family protein [Myxococcota bacterium]
MRRLLLGGALALMLAGPASAQDPVPAAVTLDGNRLVLPGAISFATATATITPESESALAAAVAWLQAKTVITTVRVEGHSDSDGDPFATQALTEARAMAVARALVARGVDCKRILAVGFGGNKPVADNATAEGKAQNRRVELHSAAMRDRPIGGMPLDGGGKSAGDVCAR